MKRVTQDDTIVIRRCIAGTECDDCERPAKFYVFRPGEGVKWDAFLCDEHCDALIARAERAGATVLGDR